MIYETSRQWERAPHRRLLLFGMSGVGKTHVAAMLRRTGDWYHYSVDYRIGTRYMGEHIVDNFKREAMRNPFLAELLRSDSIQIHSKIGFGNLDPLSTYLGKPGSKKKSGLPFAEYRRRLEQHRRGEIAAMEDTAQFMERAQDLYGYRNFVCDASGSICEVLDADDSQPLLDQLGRTLLPVWIRGSEAHARQLVDRFRASPKPMYYRLPFLERHWKRYLEENGLKGDEVDPDAFCIWIFERAMRERQPRYEALAQRGLIVEADEVAEMHSAGAFCELIGRAIDRAGARTCP